MMTAGRKRVGAGVLTAFGLLCWTSAAGAETAFPRPPVSAKAETLLVSPGVGPARVQPVAAAGPAPAVLEMFTAQGCAACPPADAIFARFADAPGVIALALHVDYWDYLGWEDSFANPAYTERQKAYARAAKAKMIYTPQVIISGTARVQGNQGAEIETLLEAQKARPAAVSLNARTEGRKLFVEASASTGLATGSEIHLVRYLPREDVSIHEGENAGHEVVYRNIVTEWRLAGAWDGTTPLALEAALSREVSPEFPLVVIVQEAGPGPILAAQLLE